MRKRRSNEAPERTPADEHCPEGKGGPVGKNTWCLPGKRSRIARILRTIEIRELPGRMSDLPSSRRLKPNASQLPVSWYFDPQVFELEQKLLFANSPGYVGHE